MATIAGMKMMRFYMELEKGICVDMIGVVYVGRLALMFGHAYDGKGEWIAMFGVMGESLNSLLQCQ